MNGPHARVSSPCAGSSIFSTSAPMSPSIIVQYGPATTRVRSTTRTPLSGGMFGLFGNCVDAADRELRDVAGGGGDFGRRRRRAVAEAIGDGVVLRVHD